MAHIALKKKSGIHTQVLRGPEKLQAHQRKNGICKSNQIYPAFQSTNRPSKHTESVLLVEDNEMVMNLVENMLKCLGYAVICAQDGFEAVHIFRQKAHAIGLILSDVSMPGKNGWQVLAETRTIRSDIPVILTSGYYEAPIRSPRVTHQPQAFLHKPFTLDALQRTIENVMHHCHMEPAT